MKTEKENGHFREIGAVLENLILTALPDSGASVRYDGGAECFYVTTYGREHDVSVACDGPAGALRDIGIQLLSKKL